FGHKKMIGIDMCTTSLGGIKLQSPLLNASGPLTKTYQNLQAIDMSGSSAVVSKTCTLVPSTGNQKPKLTIIDFHSLNSDGLENYGVEYYQELRFTKPYIMS